MVKTTFHWPEDGFSVWYGNAFGWPADDPVQVAKDHARFGIAADIIELAAGFGNMKVDGYANPEVVRRPWKRKIAANRAHGVITFVSVTNANVRLTKHGNQGRSLSQLRENCKKLHHMVMNEGPEGIIVQPCGEAGDDWVPYEMHWGREFHKRGFRLVFNRGSRPTPPAPEPFDYTAHHAHNPFGRFPRGVIEMTDNSGPLRALQNKNLYGKGNPEAVQRFLQDTCTSGCLVGAYFQAFWLKHDPGIAFACGAMVKGLS